MIPDKVFKSLKHSYAGYSIFLNGQNLVKGYKPDFVLKKGDNYLIFECENSSSRKTYVGGMMKAAHFLQQKRKGRLVFVVVQKENTTSLSIAKHLSPYLDWIQGKTNLTDVFVIATTSYFSKGKVLDIGCADFQKLAHKVHQLR